MVKPILKWAGGKEKELEVIKSYLPEKFDKYVEPFVGGGSVFLNFGTKKSFINDKSEELINLYKVIKAQDKNFFSMLETINESWIGLENFADKNPEELIDLYLRKKTVDDFINNYKKEFKALLKNEIFLEKRIFTEELNRNLISKINRTERISKAKGHISETDIILIMETALKSAFYMYLRYLYNLNLKEHTCSSFSAAIFFFIREYCYASMFRYSKEGKFNVPYGGISYNRKKFKTKIEYLKSDEIQNQLKTVKIENLDFAEFLNVIDLTENDFIFLDPPYDTEFSTYAKNQFDKQDQIRLTECLRKTKAKFMLVIKNTDFIYELYKDFNVKTFEKNYLVSFKNRNNRKTQHLIIMNYGD